MSSEAAVPCPIRDGTTAHGAPTHGTPAGAAGAGDTGGELGRWSPDWHTRAWHVAMWGVLGIAGIRLLVAVDLTAATRVTAAGVLAALGATYAVAVQRGGTPRGASHPDPIPDRLRRIGYLTVATLAVGWLCALDPALSLTLFIIYPHTWLLTTRRRDAIAATCAVTVSACAGLVARGGWQPAVLREVGPQLLVSLLFSLLIGLWITHIVGQARQMSDLLRQVEQAQAQLNAAHQAQGVMAERERLAREIHDTLAQGFTSVVMLAQGAVAALPADAGATGAALERIESVARDNLAEARSLVAAFTPVDLAGVTLREALGRLAERFGRETGVAVTLEVVAGVDALDLNREVVLLRAVQEALTNVRRHARASTVTIRLVPEVDADGDAMRLEVRDDGVGFAPAAPPPGVPGGGFGLAGMRGRVEEVGGELAVEAEPGAGTAVLVRLPAVPR